ncbi:hypothetical protein 13VV501A_gene0047 [Vibrio phage 13VV501A]|nr:hypothetical protein 13VV501A_gene0047 [Vibrio phage 13VV501A]
MRMSEVFALPVYSGTQDVHIINKEKPCVVSGTSTVLVARPKYIEAVIHAVNNHDRLIDENAKLRGMLERIAEYAEFNGDYLLPFSVDEIKEQLLNGESKS